MLACPRRPALAVPCTGTSGTKCNATSCSSGVLRALVTAPSRRRRRQQRQPAAGEAADTEPSPFDSADFVDPERDDDVLPDSLTDALQAAAEATCLAMERGCERCVVEILLPEFWDPLSGPVYAEEGDQQRFWKLTRRFIDNVVAARPGSRLRAVYPDAGVSAMLRNQWPDAGFAFSSLNDRYPVAAEDEVVVLAAPDPQGVDQAIKISGRLEAGQTLVMFNPRLASGDVGVGLNVRRMRESFLKGFATTYSLCPIGDVGSVFRRYPGMWQVFVQDAVMPGRYKLAAEQASRPGGEDLDLIIANALGGGGEGGSEGGEGSALGVADQIGITLSGLQRFMRSLSR